MVAGLFGRMGGDVKVALLYIADVGKDKAAGLFQSGAKGSMLDYLTVGSVDLILVAFIGKEAGFAAVFVIAQLVVGTGDSFV